MASMFRPLKPEEVEVRVNQCTDKGVSLLLFKTARTDMDLLDETVGAENWQNRYETIDGKLFCELGIRCDGEWVWKSDTGTESNMEAQKGEASDAFKRSGFRWGIGRELYTAPFVWVGSDACSIKQGRNGKPQCYDKFKVTELEVDDGRIVKLQICNMSRKGAVVYGHVARRQQPAAEEPSDGKQAVTGDLAAAMADLKAAEAEFCKKNKEILNADGITTVAEFHDQRVRTRGDYKEEPGTIGNIAYELRECVKGQK